MEKKKYSLWVLPTGQAKAILDAEINRLAKLFGFTPFLPHLTILGTIMDEEEHAQQLCRQLVSQVEPFELQSGEISFSTTFFQNVLVRTLMNPGLGNCYLEASKVFGSEVGVLMPHFSLIYGNHTQEERANMATLAKVEPFSFTVDRLYLIETNTTEYTKWRPVEEFVLRE